VFVVFVQQRATPSAGLVLKRLGVVGLGVRVDPVVDALASYAEQAGDVSGGPALIELKDGEGTPQQAGVGGSSELTPQPLSLPGS
jgi:hypothetical protein